MSNIEGLIRSAGLTEDAITAKMASMSVDRETAVKRLFSEARADMIMQALMTPPSVPTDEDNARIAAAQARVQAAIAERNTKNARAAVLRAEIAAHGPCTEPDCPSTKYAELLTLL